MPSAASLCLAPAAMQTLQEARAARGTASLSGMCVQNAASARSRARRFELQNAEGRQGAGVLGETQHGSIPISSATATACSPAAPPNAIITKSRGSTPLFEQRQTDRGAEVGVGDGKKPLGSGFHAIARAALRQSTFRSRPAPPSASSCIPPPRKPFTIEPAERDVGVRYRRLHSPVGHSTHGPGRDPALSGPTVNRPPGCTFAIEPPPAPMVRIRPWAGAPASDRSRLA